MTMNHMSVEIVGVAHFKHQSMVPKLGITLMTMIRRIELQDRATKDIDNASFVKNTLQIIQREQNNICMEMSQKRMLLLAKSFMVGLTSKKLKGFT